MSSKESKKRKADEQETAAPTATTPPTVASASASASASETASTPTIKTAKGNTTNGGKTKKKKTNNTSSSSTDTKKTAEDDYKPLTLAQIRTKVKELTNRIPTIPPTGIDPDNNQQVREWATAMQAVIEQFNLLLCLVSTATYKWGTDRSGAADQHLSLLSNELGNAQDQITSSITPRLTNVLAPVVDLVTKQTITTTHVDEVTKKDVKTKVNTFAREVNDPGFVRLCNVILSRNALMLRQVVLTNFYKVGKCIDDYLKATKKDSSGRNAYAY